MDRSSAPHHSLTAILTDILMPSLAESLESLEAPDAADLAAADADLDPAPADPESVPVTGYELDEEDWASLLLVKDGRSEDVSAESTEWLRTAGLLDDSGALTPFAIEWVAWAE